MLYEAKVVRLVYLIIAIEGIEVVLEDLVEPLGLSIYL